MLFLLEEAVADGEAIHLGSHEAMESVFGRTDDGLAAGAEGPEGRGSALAELEKLAQHDAPVAQSDTALITSLQ